MPFRCKETGKETHMLAEGLSPDIYEKSPLATMDSKSSVFSNVSALEEELGELIEQFKRLGHTDIEKIEGKFAKRMNRKELINTKISTRQALAGVAGFVLLSGVSYGGFWYYNSSQNSWQTTVINNESLPEMDNHETTIVDPNDPFKDTDGDRIPDIKEPKFGLNPNSADTDGDGLNDYDEIVIYGTDPTVEDTDGDGLSDGDEIMAGTDPLDPKK